MIINKKCLMKKSAESHLHICRWLVCSVLAPAGLFLGLSIPCFAKEIYVSPTGLMPYETISAGVEAASDGDNVIIFPGTYEESITVNNKSINLIGTDRENCILINDTENYLTPPLMIASGSVQNMTIIAARKEVGSIFDLYDEIANDPTKGAVVDYAVHIDSDESHGKWLTFLNCTIRSECSHAMGVGLRDGFTLTIENCELSSENLSYPIFIHDSAVNYKGESFVNFKSDVFHAPGLYAMGLMSFDGVNNHVNLSFEKLDISDTAGVYLIVNKDKQTGDGIGGSESFYLNSGIESDPTIVVKKTLMPCSIWSGASTMPGTRVKFIPADYEVKIYPFKIKSLENDGKEFYMTIKGAYILCRCVDEEQEEEITKEEITKEQEDEGVPKVFKAFQ